MSLGQGAGLRGGASSSDPAEPQKQRDSKQSPLLWKPVVRKSKCTGPKPASSPRLQAGFSLPAQDMRLCDQLDRFLLTWGPLPVAAT